MRARTYALVYHVGQSQVSDRFVVVAQPQSPARQPAETEARYLYWSLCKDRKTFSEVCKWVMVRRRQGVHKNRFEDHARPSRSQMAMIGFCLGGSFFEIRSEDRSGPLCGMPSANTGSPGGGGGGSDRSNRKRLCRIPYLMSWSSKFDGWDLERTLPNEAEMVRYKHCPD